MTRAPRARPLRRRAGRAAAAAAALALPACANFATVRSAEVRPGWGASASASATAGVGDAAGWFYSLDCASACDGNVVGVDLAASHGWRRGPGGRPVAVALGTSGVFPYLDGYVQLGRGGRPFGVGARVGLPVFSWTQHQLYGRVDVPLGRETRLLLNPGLLLHTGSSPNGANTGSFVAFVQGVGLEVGAGAVAFTPAVSLVAGRAEHTSYGGRVGPATTVFPAASLGVTLRRPRER